MERYGQEGTANVKLLARSFTVNRIEGRPIMAPSRYAKAQRQTPPMIARDDEMIERRGTALPPFNLVRRELGVQRNLLATTESGVAWNPKNFFARNTPW